ncbi:MAG TPA: FAD:protein FMN transferase [Vicinamibacteria bacterium]|nr:FAD:protein FMN transferase [Vicinamibacteria bacterium]
MPIDSEPDQAPAIRGRAALLGFSAFRLALYAFLVLACAHSERRNHAPEARFEGESMGTTYTVVLVAELSQGERSELERIIRAALDEVDAAMSTYRDDSELSRFNRAPPGEPFSLSPETLEVVSEAIAVSEMTGGAFDVTVAPLVRLWGFGPLADRDRLPTDEELAAAMSRVGYRHLAVDRAGGTLAKDLDGVECDLSAIAKGYGVDRVASALERFGIGNYMIELGGEVRTLGVNPSGEPWKIAIEKPVFIGRDIERIVPLSGLSVATSGDYRHFITVDGVTRSHLIDPRTGRPVQQGLASVSVVEKNCMRADALASALFVLGPDDGLELASRKGLAALFLIRNEDGSFEERSTPAFDALTS